MPFQPSKLVIPERRVVPTGLIPFRRNHSACACHTHAFRGRSAPDGVRFRQSAPVALVWLPLFAEGEKGQPAARPVLVAMDKTPLRMPHRVRPDRGQGFPLSPARRGGGRKDADGRCQIGITAVNGIKVGSLMQKKWVKQVAGVIAVTLGLGVCMVGLALRLLSFDVLSSNTPVEMFEYVIASPVPTDVVDLQGGGDTWQGYNLWLRFRASETAIQQLLAHEYEQVECEQILPYLELNHTGIEFQTPWQPESIEERQCYWTPDIITNPWTSAGQHYLLVDMNMQEIYFRGIGM